MEMIVVQTSCPSLEEARQIGTLLVESKMAKCVKILPQVESVYLWEGKLCHKEEVVLQIKGLETNLSGIVEITKKAHPYDVPEIWAAKPTFVDARYHAWLVDDSA